jgi:hypothetical protein
LAVLAAAALPGALAPLTATFAATGLAAFALATAFAGEATRFAGAAALACAFRTALAGCFAADALCAAPLGRAAGADFDLRFRGIAVSLDS